MRVLVIEDEPELNGQLSRRLREQGYAVDSAENGGDGLYYGREYPVDVAIVDLGLPDISGIEVIRRLRAEDRNFPILILTARALWQEKVEGLEAGADDYLVKPFHFEELAARLRALIRRSGRVVSKSQLVEHIYDEDNDRDSNVIEVFIGRLRKKLDPDGEINPIQTLRGRGYRLNPGLDS